MFNHMVLEPRCGALRPGALQLGGAQTGYLHRDYFTLIRTGNSPRLLFLGGEMIGYRCFQLQVTWFHHALIFTASLSKIENGVKSCCVNQTFRSIHAKVICSIESFKVFVGNWTLVFCGGNQSLLRKIFQWCVQSFFCRLECFISNDWKRLSLRSPDKNLSSRERMAFIVLRLHGFPSAFLRKNASTLLTVPPAPRFQVRQEFFSPSSMLKLEENGWFIL